MEVKLPQSNSKLNCFPPNHKHNKCALWYDDVGKPHIGETKDIRF